MKNQLRSLTLKLHKVLIFNMGFQTNYHTVYFFTFFILLPLAITAQIPNQFIRGAVESEWTSSPIEKVSIKLLNGSTEEYLSETDSTGSFEFNVPVGRYQIELTAIGYEGLKISEPIFKDVDFNTIFASILVNPTKLGTITLCLLKPLPITKSTIVP